MPVTGTGRRTRAVAIVVRPAAIVAALVAAYYLVPFAGDDGTGGGGELIARAAGTVVLVALAGGLGLHTVGTTPNPTLRAAETLTTTVAVAVLGFAATYHLASLYDPAAFTEELSRTDSLYFAMTTATTVGFGDIAARSEPVRLVVMAQMVTNVVVLGVITRLVVHAARRRADDEAERRR